MVEISMIFSIKIFHGIFAQLIRKFGTRFWCEISVRNFRANQKRDFCRNFRAHDKTCKNVLFLATKKSRTISPLIFWKISSVSAGCGTKNLGPLPGGPKRTIFVFLYKARQVWRECAISPLGIVAQTKKLKRTEAFFYSSR